MPPVFGPMSPSKAGLWSWAGCKVTIVWPSVMASTLASWPSSRSSMISRSPAVPKTFSGDGLDGGDRLLAAGANDDPFAGSQPVGLDHHGHVFAVAEKLDGFLGVAEGLIVSRGDIGVRKRSLQKTLLPSSSAAALLGPKDAQPGLLEGIDDACRQRGFRSHDRHAHLIVLGKLDQGVEPVGDLGKSSTASGDVFAVDVGARVARRHENPLRARALRDFPSQGVFSPTVADDQDIHCRTPRPCPNPRISGIVMEKWTAG